MNHYYSFEHGEELTLMGASWFVSYSWFRYVDRTHLNWKKVRSYPSRISTYINNKRVSQVLFRANRENERKTFNE